MLTVWMAFWWMTEATSLELTSLLPILILPLTGLYSDKPMMQACAKYGDESVFFFLGGFGLGLAIEKTTLHRRGALMLLRCAGRRADYVVGAFMISTALLSMWMNNTATTILMLPLAMSVVANQDDKRFSTSLIIGVAYASSIGGMGTLVGTAPNIFFTGFLKDNGMKIGFLPWMAIAMPIVIFMLVGCWVWMVKILWPIRDLNIEIPQTWKDEWAASRGLTMHQWTTLIVFAVAVAFWLGHDAVTSAVEGMPAHGWLKPVSDAWIAMASLIALMIFPLRDPVLQWSDVEKIPWGVLLLFGGGLSLAAAISKSGLDNHIARSATILSGLPPWVMVTVMVVLVIGISELASNLATATTMIPILMSAAPSIGIPPLMLITAAVLASSCGFMLPIATPPNTLAFAQRRFPVKSMLLAGLGTNLLGIVSIPIAVHWIMPLVVDLTQ